MIYLASPYSSPNEQTQRSRFNCVCRCAAELMKKGHLIFSPIAHTHPIAQYDLPKGWEFWKKYDEEFLERCDELWVLKLEGWQQSKGVTAEIRIMEKLGKPVRFVDPGNITEEKPPDAIGRLRLAIEGIRIASAHQAVNPDADASEILGHIWGITNCLQDLDRKWLEFIKKKYK